MAVCACRSERALTSQERNPLRVPTKVASGEGGEGRRSQSREERNPVGVPTKIVPVNQVMPEDAGVGEGPVVLYDGVCGLCNRYVQFVLRRDRQNRFRFAPLQGAFGSAALARHGLALGSDPSFMVLLEAPGSADERARVRSDAVLAVMSGLGGAWRASAVLRIVPRVVRDAIYDLVARVRYRIFGRLDACPIPSPAQKRLFL